MLHLATGGGGPSERNFADVHVLSEKRASLTRTRDDIDDPWRDASSSDELAQEYGLEWKELQNLRLFIISEWQDTNQEGRFLGSLDHNAVTGSNRWAAILGDWYA